MRLQENVPKMLRLLNQRLEAVEAESDDSRVISLQNDVEALKTSMRKFFLKEKSNRIRIVNVAPIVADQILNDLQSSGCCIANQNMSSTTSTSTMGKAEDENQFAVLDKSRERINHDESEITNIKYV